MAPHELGTLCAGEYFGSIVQSIAVADARLSLVRHEKKQLLPLHQHECAYFCLLLHGSYTEYYGQNAIMYRPFMMALHPPRFRHSDEIGSAGSVFFMIELDEPWVGKLSEVVDLNAVKVELHGSDMVWLAMRLFKVFIEFDQEGALHVESLLYELVAGAARVHDMDQHESAGWFERANAYLKNHYLESLTMKQIADAAGVHPVTLARCFRRHHQQTVSEYINRLRVRLSCEMLLSGNDSIANISADCGFVDQSYFTRVFKGIVGTTPGSLRRTFSGALS